MRRMLVAIIVAAVAASAAAQHGPFDSRALAQGRPAHDGAPPKPLYDVMEKGIVELQEAMTRGQET